MRFRAFLTPRSGGPFDKKVSRLARKFPNLPTDLATTWAELLGPPPVPIPSGQRVVVMQRTAPDVVLKVRVASSDMGKGASGGFRVVLFNQQLDHWLPVLIYAKNDQEDVSPAEVRKAIKEETSPPEPAESDESDESDSPSPPASPEGRAEPKPKPEDPPG